MSSLTLTVVLDHETSYQFSVRMRKNACCDFSPCAEAGAVPSVANATPATSAETASLANLVTIDIFIGLNLPVFLGKERAGDTYPSRPSRHSFSRDRSRLSSCLRPGDARPGLASSRTGSFR